MLSGFPTPGPLHRRSPRLDHYHFLHLISATSLLSLLTTSCPLEMLFDRQTDRNQLCCSSCCRRCLQDHNNRCHHRTHAHTHRRTYKQHAVTAGNYFPRLGASQLCRASLSLGTLIQIVSSCSRQQKTSQMPPRYLSVESNGRRIVSF